MPVYHDNDSKRATWRCVYRVRGADGRVRQTQKRGFKTKRDAMMYERLQLMSSQNDTEITFKQFFEDCYSVSKRSECKPTTWATFENRVNMHILPVFGNMRMADITPLHILNWTNSLRRQKQEGKYSNEYLRSIYSSLRAIFNFAEAYGPYENPMKKTHNFRKEKAKEKTVWTPEQYHKFASVIRSEGDVLSGVLFDILYYGGLRISEALALTADDVDTVNNTVRINKSYQVINNEKLILTPKTVSSDRVVPIPSSLASDLSNYIARLPYLHGDERIFSVSRSFVYGRLKKYTALAELPKIQIHSFRRSYITLLLHMKYFPIEVSKMVGHSNPTMVYQYSYPYLSVEKELAQELDKVRLGQRVFEFK